MISQHVLHFNCLSIIIKRVIFAKVKDFLDIPPIPFVFIAFSALMPMLSLFLRIFSSSNATWLCFCHIIICQFYMWFQQFLNTLLFNIIKYSVGGGGDLKVYLIINLQSIFIRLHFTRINERHVMTLMKMLVLSRDWFWMGTDFCKWSIQ